MKTITFGCDAAGCSESAPVPCEDRCNDVFVPGWTNRKVSDTSTNARGVTVQDEDAVFHYCPRCTARLAEPPLSSAMRKHIARGVSPDETP